MSCYLYFYLVPKNEEKKSMVVASFSKNHCMFEPFYEGGVPYSENNSKYKEITLSFLDEIECSVNKEINESKDRLLSYYETKPDNNNIELYSTWQQDIIDIKDYIKELEKPLIMMKFLYQMIYDLEFSDDFEKIIANIE